MWLIAAWILWRVALADQYCKIQTDSSSGYEDPTNDLNRNRIASEVSPLVMGQDAHREGSDL